MGMWEGKGIAVWYPEQWQAYKWEAELMGEEDEEVNAERMWLVIK